ncbi:MAG: hypothetical protein LBK54_05910 [Propionibacteriaceae bacterium]|jgi:hypothetical protein|nr:hypothetical protein [Propionibacteriaceae bacterium]
MDWSVLGGVALLALVALLGGAWVDRTNRLRRRAALAEPPERVVPGLEPDRGKPHYVPTHAFDQARAGQPLTPDQRQRLEQAIAKSTSLEGGWARDRFVTDPDTRWAVLWRPLVLVAERIGSFRELLAPIEEARRLDCGLVVVADGFDPASLDTLSVNALSGRLDCLAVRCPGPSARAVAAMAVGASVVETSQLRAGWLGPDSLGRPAVWVSAQAQSWAIIDGAIAASD